METIPAPIFPNKIIPEDEQDQVMPDDQLDVAIIVEEETGEVIHDLEEEEKNLERGPLIKNSLTGDATPTEHLQPAECDWSMFEKIC